MKLKPFLIAAAMLSLLAACNEKTATEESPEAKPSAETEAQAEAQLQTEQQKLSYLLGSSVASQFKNDGIEVDTESFTLGISDVLQGVELRLSPEESQAVFERFTAEMQAKQQARQVAMAAAAEENLKAGEAFLLENAAKEGVKVLESGLQYKVLTAGTGATPGLEDMVEVNYRGRLLDGTEFDSSYAHGQTAKFGVDQVIPGWTEALQLMKEGAVWELYVPSNLAYGPVGAPPTIPANSTLIFEVELLKVGDEAQ